MGTQEKVAIKTESASCEEPRLEFEAATLKYFTEEFNPQGFCKCHWYGSEKGWNFVVMDLLGKSLEDMQDACKGKYNARTTTMVAQQVLTRLEYFHSRCY